MEAGSVHEASSHTKTTSTLRKYIPFDLDTAAITESAAEYLDPEKLTPLLNEHKSGIIVAAIWLTLYLRSWFSILPFPGLSLTFTFTLPFILLVLTSFTRDGSGKEADGGIKLTGLSYHFYAEISCALSKLYRKTLPSWVLSHVVPVVLLFPLARAVTLLLFLAGVGIARKYHAGVAKATRDADAAVRRAEDAIARAAEHARAARALEMQALQLAAVDTSRGCVDSVRKIKAEAEQVVAEVAGPLRRKVEKVRTVAEGASAAARNDGDLEFSGEMLVNLDKLVARLEKAEGELGVKVEKARESLWKLTLRE